MRIILVWSRPGVFGAGVLAASYPPVASRRWPNPNLSNTSSYRSHFRHRLHMHFTRVGTDYVP